MGIYQPAFFYLKKLNLRVGGVVFFVISFFSVNFALKIKIRMKKGLFVVFLLFFAIVCHAQTSHTRATARSSSIISDDSIYSSVKSGIKAKVLLEGDVNGDDLVNVLDIVDLARYLKGKARTAFVKSNADINHDGVINKADLNSLSVLIIDDMPVTTPELEPLRGDSNGSPQW